jgi:hypothetical protein
MAGAASNLRWVSRVLILTAALGGWAPIAWTQAAASDAAAVVQPLPDIDVGRLMHEVEARQKAAEAIEKDYLYHAVDTVEQLDRQGKVKKTQTKEYDVFWMEGVPVRKLTRKDGRALSADEQRKESERIDKAVKKAREKRAKAEAKGKETDPNGNEEVTVSRLLELGSFGNARRVTLDGRRTIAVDFAGDPKAETRNRMEAVIRDTGGTVWVDEQDRALAKVEGHFLKSFKIGAGLVVNIGKGTRFSMVQRKVNGEVWLPERIEGRGTARAFLLFSFSGSFREIDSDYRKFKVTTTILPGMGKAEEKE